MILGNTCFATCPDTYYPRIFECVPCVGSCLTCYSELECKSCLPGKFLYYRTCVDACSPGMTVINGNECLVCDAQCKTCSSATFCTSCFPTNYLYNGSCYTICPNGTYRSIASQSCLPCDNPCEFCSPTSTYCITCLNKALFVDSGACVPVCSGNLIPVNTVCTACSPVCLTCIVQITNCVRCQPGFFFVSNGSLPSCVSTCTTGYLLDNNVTTNRDCIPACPSKFFATGLGSLCVPCATGCSVCSGSASNCSQCDATYFLYSADNSCNLVCPVPAPYPRTAIVNSSSVRTC